MIIDTLFGIMEERKRNSTKLSEEEIIKVVCDISRGLDRLHTNRIPIIHKNLRVITIDIHKNAVD
jgi:hypothetical protein